MNTIEEIAERFYSLLDNSKPIPFTESLKVNRKEFEDLIYELKLSVPQSIKDAEGVIDNCHEYIENAENEAQTIVADAQMEAQKLLSEHEVYIRAVDEAEKITDSARDEIEESVNQMKAYIDSILEEAEKSMSSAAERVHEETQKSYKVLDECIDEVYELRKGIRE